MARKNRTVVRVSDSKKGSAQALSELKSSLLEQAVTGKPKNGSTVVNKTDSKLSSNEVSKRNAFASYSNISSNLGVTFSTFSVSVEKDDDGNTILGTGPVRDIDEFFVSQGDDEPSPDLLPKEVIKGQAQDIDNNFAGISALVENLLEPVVSLGVESESTPVISNPSGDTVSLKQGAVARMATASISLSRGNVQGLNRTITVDDFKGIPNHFKGILRTGGISQTATVSGLFSESAAEVSNAKAEISFTYDMIAKISYLAGYEKTESGVPMMSRPMWEELTLDKYNELSGQSVLCKMELYSNPALGVSPSKGLKPNIHDEYFFLVPRALAPKPSGPAYTAVPSSGGGTTLVPENDLADIQALDQQRIDLPGELTSNNQNSNITLDEAIANARKINNGKTRI